MDSSTEAKCAFAAYLLLPTIGKGGAVNLHLPSCNVFRGTPHHVCACATVSDVKGQHVLDTLRQLMRISFAEFVRLFVSTDDDAKLSKLREMKTYAEETLMTPMPTVTPADASAVQEHFELLLEKYSNARVLLGL